MNRIRQVHVDTLSCEPILRKTPSGELLCVSQCGGVIEPAPENRVFFFHSQDDGETWSKPQSVYPEDGNAVYCTEVMVHEGVISVFLTLHSGRFLDWKNVVMQSRDNGYTWENAGPPPLLPTFTFMRGALTLKNGDILIAYHHFPVTQEENDRVLAFGGKAVWETNATYFESGVLRSTDNGKTYQKHVAGIWDRDATEMSLGWVWSEPTLAQLSDGTISMLLRKDRSGWLWRCDSKDGGQTWGEIYNTQIPNPSNKPKLIPLDDGRIALIHTPNNSAELRPGWGLRFPLQIWISSDDMQSWPYRETVTDFPGNYSYADGFYEDGHIKFTIEYNRHDVIFVDHTIKA